MTDNVRTFTPKPAPSPAPRAPQAPAVDPDKASGALKYAWFLHATGQPFGALR